MLVIAPVCVLVVLGLPNVNLEGLRAGPDARSQSWPGFLTLILWNTCGYDSAGTIAAEVADPGRVYVPAMSLCIVFSTLVYALPTIVGVCTATGGGAGTTRPVLSFMPHLLLCGEPYE